LQSSRLKEIAGETDKIMIAAVQNISEPEVVGRRGEWCKVMKKKGVASVVRK
jgi:hypothetical protein